MGLKGIMSISGMPGLYKVLVQSKTGFIVESLADGKRLPVSSTQRISMLEDISIFTSGDDLPLKDVFLKLKALSSDNTVIDPKSAPEQLRTFFKGIVPDYDIERVYPSDIKKIINWFSLVKDIVDVQDEGPEENSDETTEGAEPGITESKSENSSTGEEK